MIEGHIYVSAFAGGVSVRSSNGSNGGWNVLMRVTNGEKALRDNRNNDELLATVEKALLSTKPPNGRCKSQVNTNTNTNTSTSTTSEKDMEVNITMRDPVSDVKLNTKKRGADSPLKTSKKRSKVVDMDDSVIEMIAIHELESDNEEAEEVEVEEEDEQVLSIRKYAVEETQEEINEDPTYIEGDQYEDCDDGDVEYEEVSGEVSAIEVGHGDAWSVCSTMSSDESDDTDGVDDLENMFESDMQTRRKKKESEKKENKKKTIPVLSQTRRKYGDRSLFHFSEKQLVILRSPEKLYMLNPCTVFLIRVRWDEHSYHPGTNIAILEMVGNPMTLHMHCTWNQFVAIYNDYLGTLSSPQSIFASYWSMSLIPPKIRNVKKKITKDTSLGDAQHLFVYNEETERTLKARGKFATVAFNRLIGCWQSIPGDLYMSLCSLLGTHLMLNLVYCVVSESYRKGALREFMQQLYDEITLNPVHACLGMLPSPWTEMVGCVDNTRLDFDDEHLQSLPFETLRIFFHETFLGKTFTVQQLEKFLSNEQICALKKHRVILRVLSDQRNERYSCAMDIAKTLSPSNSLTDIMTLLPEKQEPLKSKILSCETIPMLMYDCSLSCVECRRNTLFMQEEENPLIALVRELAGCDTLFISKCTQTLCELERYVSVDKLALIPNGQVCAEYNAQNHTFSQYPLTTFQELVKSSGFVDEPERLRTIKKKGTNSRATIDVRKRQAIFTQGPLSMMNKYKTLPFSRIFDYVILFEADLLTAMHLENIPSFRRSMILVGDRIGGDFNVLPRYGSGNLYAAFRSICGTSSIYSVMYPGSRVDQYSSEKQCAAYASISAVFRRSEIRENKNTLYFSLPGREPCQPSMQVQNPISELCMPKIHVIYSLSQAEGALKPFHLMDPVEHDKILHKFPEHKEVKETLFLVFNEGRDMEKANTMYLKSVHDTVKIKGKCPVIAGDLVADYVSGNSCVIAKSYEQAQTPRSVSRNSSSGYSSNSGDSNHSACSIPLQSPITPRKASKTMLFPQTPKTPGFNGISLLDDPEDSNASFLTMDNSPFAAETSGSRNSDIPLLHDRRVAHPENHKDAYNQKILVNSINGEIDVSHLLAGNVQHWQNCTRSSVEGNIVIYAPDVDISAIQPTVLTEKGIVTMSNLATAVRMACGMTRFNVFVLTNKKDPQQQLNATALSVALQVQKDVNFSFTCQISDNFLFGRKMNPRHFHLRLTKDEIAQQNALHDIIVESKSCTSSSSVDYDSDEM